MDMSPDSFDCLMFMCENVHLYQATGISGKYGSPDASVHGYMTRV